MSSKLTEVDPSAIAGNASDRVKKLIANPVALLTHTRTFAQHIFARLVLTEVSIHPKAQEPEKLEARVVYEIEVGPGTQLATFFQTGPQLTVDADMLNGGGTMHGACAAMLVDK